MDHGEMARFIEWQEGSEGRVQSEKTVEIESGQLLTVLWTGQCQVLTQLIEMCIPIRDDHGESVCRAALEKADQRFLAVLCVRLRSKYRSTEKGGTDYRSETDGGESNPTVFDKNPSRDIHGNSFLLFQEAPSTLTDMTGGL
jgi:hypothetical protein